VPFICREPNIIVCSCAYNYCRCRQVGIFSGVHHKFRCKFSASMTHVATRKVKFLTPNFGPDLIHLASFDTAVRRRTSRLRTGSFRIVNCGKRRISIWVFALQNIYRAGPGWRRAEPARRRKADKTPENHRVRPQFGSSCPPTAT